MGKFRQATGKTGGEEARRRRAKLSGGGGKRSGGSSVSMFAGSELEGGDEIQS